MAGLDRVTEFQIARIPVGAGLVGAAGLGIAEGAAAVLNKFLGSTVGQFAVPLSLALVAWLYRQSFVDRMIGSETGSVAAMATSLVAVDSLLSVRATTRNLVASVVGGGAAAPALGLGQAARGLPARQAFTSEVHRKAALARL